MDFNFITILISLAIIIFTLVIFFSRPKLATRHNLPPWPARLPIIGNLHQLGKIPHQSLHKLSQKHGPVILLKLGQIETLVVSSPDSARDVMKINDVDCCSRPYSHGANKLSYNNLDIAFGSYTDYWKKIRKLCVMELFTVKRVKSYAHVRESLVETMIDYLRQLSGSPVNLNEQIFDLASSFISAIAFGNTKFEGGKRFEASLSEAMAMFSSFWAADFFPGFGSFLDRLMGQHKRLNRIFKDFDEFYEKAIEEHLDPTRLKSDHEDIVDILVRLMSKDETSPIQLTKDHIKAILMDVLVGGTDTSSVTIVWAMTELARNPRVMKKVQTEIRSIIGKNLKVHETEVGKMNYLKMVVKETFRLHPPAPLLLPRETMRHCKIGGYDIYPKTRILVNVWSIGRDPKIWEKPDEFYPERFESSGIDFSGNDFELLPFGAGRRICPALVMGATAVEYTLANLLYHFKWELPDGMAMNDISVEEKTALVVHKHVPLCLVPVKYDFDVE